MAMLPWEQYLLTEAVGTYLMDEGLVYQLKITVNPGELFCVVRAKGPFGARVAFTSAKTFKQLAGRVREVLSGEGGKWQDDKYG